MRVAIVFFLSLCFFSFVNIFQANAASRLQTGGHALRPHTEKIQQALGGTYAAELPMLRKNTVTETKDEVVIFEDEDEEFVFQKKNLLPTGCLIVLHSTALTFHLYNYFKKSLPYCSFLSCNSSPKYILQRVLRI